MSDQTNDMTPPEAEATTPIDQQPEVAGTPQPTANEAPAAEAEEPTATFDQFGLCPELLQGVAAAGFTEPTPIQVKAIPIALEGRDVLGQALTGTGKTAAFGLAGMERIRSLEGLQMLVLTPTRELAAQISSELFKLGHFTGLKPVAFTGGQSYRRQEELLSRGVNILVATPGRLIDLMNSGHFEGVNPAVIVVDEADEMLDMGFIDDVKEIFGHFPGPHQTMLFSATMPKQVESLASDILRDPVRVETDYPEAANNEIEQNYFIIEDYERANAVARLIESEQVTKAIVFCRTREETDSLNILLGGRGYNVNCLHGDMEQAQRTRVMAAFRRGDFDILVATDVAARGIDVDDVSHVFNYHLPFDSRSYVHRIGRTGRAGKTGKAITFVTPRELRSLEAIRRSVGANLTLGMIPSRTEVNAQRLQRLLAELFASNLDPKLYQKVTEMIAQEDQDPVVLFTKMLSRALAASSDQGPERIGLSQEKIDYLLEKRNRRYGRQGGRRDSYDRDRPYGRKSYYREDRPFRGERSERPFREERPEREERPFREEREERPFREEREERPFREERPEREERPFRERRYDDRPYERRPYGDRPYRDRDDRPYERRPYGDRPYDRKPYRDDHAYGAPKRFSKPEPPMPDAPKPIALNPDGTPKLNRKQRRLLKFGPPRQDNGEGGANPPPEQ